MKSPTLRAITTYSSAIFLIDFPRTTFAACTSLKLQDMSWRLNDDLNILHFHQLSFLQLHEVNYSAGDWINTGWWIELVFWVMSIMKERPARGHCWLLNSALRLGCAIGFTDVCLPVWLAGQCQIIISLSHDLHVSRLINAAELAASPFLLQIAMKGHAVWRLLWIHPLSLCS